MGVAYPSLWDMAVWFSLVWIMPQASHLPVLPPCLFLVPPSARGAPSASRYRHRHRHVATAASSGHQCSARLGQEHPGGTAGTALPAQRQCRCWGLHRRLLSHLRGQPLSVDCDIALLRICLLQCTWLGPFVGAHPREDCRREAHARDYCLVATVADMVMHSGTGADPDHQNSPNTPCYILGDWLHCEP